jgi:ferredoxin-NADP reductase
VRALQTRDVLHSTPRTRIIRIDLGAEPFSFTAGQAIVVGLHGGTLRKPYSIACSPRQAARTNQLELLVQIDDPDLANPHLERLTPGTLVDVEGPFGTFGIPEDAPEHDVLFVGGGTGIAPLRSMMWDMIERQPSNHLALIYSARSVDEIAYIDELRRLTDEGRVDVRLTVTRDGRESWLGPRGRIDAALVRSVVRTAETRCVLCGPPSMVASVSELLRGAGVEDDRILTETFTSP